MLHVFPNNIILEIIESAENLKIREFLKIKIKKNI